MSAGDVVCTGWLIKSPPEKKLKRFAWRKRWFVLRRGRMSGNPDVLEYYQSKSSKKPIRTIDLKECEVEMLNGQLGIKREFQEKHLFVVKTSARMFYLVAKTEEEMNSWISSISHICQFGSQEEAGSSEEGFPHTPTSLRPPSDSSGRVSPSSRRPADYLVLSQCGTGSGSTCRHSSFSNSETSLEHKSTEDVLKDIVPSPPCGASSSFHCISQFGLSPKPGGLANPPLSAPCAALAPPSSSSPLRLCAVSVFQFDQPYPRASFEAADDRRTPPPLPPKPNHLSDEGVRRPRAMSARHFPKHLALLSRRTSLSSLDHFTIGNADSRSTGNRRQTLNLSRFNTARLQSQPDESDVPMASASSCVSVIEGDGYLPMSPAVGILETRGKVEAAETLGSLARQPGGVAPPPIHRHLKPCLRRARPPPLDLRGLSTITECPAHHLFSRTKTESCFRFSGKCLAHEGSLENGDNPSNEDAYSATTESRPHFSLSVDGVVQPWARRSNLDYLSLDFNSASPSPVQKKPLLSDEHRVDYVQVDERKTQALQNTKMEWTDVRQSKT
ncbi:GRB2-associated-binding protein 3 isoform X2 [Phyllopteryx taeniolatus]|uniref:GRB2-associated-binding protein 3 isoform X2 n=1 Tax=Phyllopteryx taeniolatus TaxID=161469 RepID=UPI002AD412F1|nr:GRB2-associated-binding protein 3 isoform X2 [Phyllopteryx taeniolatus]